VKSHDYLRYVVKHDGEIIGASNQLDGAVKMGLTVKTFEIFDKEDDVDLKVPGPWKIASCDGYTLIINKPGGGQEITTLDEN